MESPFNLSNRGIVASKNRHFQFGYDQSFIPMREHLNQRFFIKPGACQRMPMDFRAESQIAAREIYSQFGGDLALCLSGGLDSEIMAEAFFYSQVPFKARIMRFEKDFNLHDISWAVIYCETRNIPYEFIDINIEDFFRSGEFKKFAVQGQCGYPFLLVHLKLMELLHQRSLVPVFGEGNMHFQQTNGRWKYLTQEFWYAHEKYLYHEQKSQLVKFYHWSPELMLSYLIGPRLWHYFKNPESAPPTLNELKWQLYNDYYPCQDRKKYRGYEKVMDLHLQYLELLRIEFGFKNETCLIEVDQLVKTLYPEELPCVPFSKN